MAAEILLSSEAFVKAVTAISDNISGKYILASLREAQEIGLRGILGDALLDKVKALRAADALTGAYKDLVDRAQYYLAYTTVVEVTNKVTYKIANFGVAKSSDENLQPASSAEIERQQFYYQSKADAACLDFQNWVYEHRADFPELTANKCRAIRANLYSAASCGIWLGGPRGKGPMKTCGR